MSINDKDIVIVTTNENKLKTIKYICYFYGVSESEIKDKIIIVKNNTFQNFNSFMYMICDTTLYKARCCDYELRFKILLYKIKRGLKYGNTKNKHS